LFPVIVEADAKRQWKLKTFCRRFHSPHDRVPRTHLLSNGRYSVLVTHAGTGVSRCGDHVLTRWVADRVEDRSGLALFVRDTTTGRYASVGGEPAGGGATHHATAWEPGSFSIERSGDALDVRLEVCVLPDVDAELRRVTVTNREYYFHTRDAYATLRGGAPKRASFRRRPISRSWRAMAATSTPAASAHLRGDGRGRTSRCGRSYEPSGPVGKLTSPRDT
jgi:hypothetical protein